jgi:hypothetical protein
MKAVLAVSYMISAIPIQKTRSNPVRNGGGDQTITRPMAMGTIEKNIHDLLLPSFAVVRSDR